RLHSISGGNPFYALELARANRGDGPLVVPDSLADVAAQRVRALPRESRLALAELALAGGSGRPVDLAGATAAGVVIFAFDGPRFTHPLLAEAAIGILTPEETCAVHAEIAAWMSDPAQRARHRALAVSEPDGRVAAELAEAATAARWRSTI